MDKGAAPVYVSFSSGGTKGVAFAGVIRALEEQFQRRWGVPYATWRTDTLRGVSGTSAGAIAALVMALGLSHEQVRHFLETELRDPWDILPCPDVKMLYEQFGIDDGRHLRERLANLLALGGLNPQTTLGVFHRITRIELMCVASNLHTGLPVYMSTWRTPDMRVVDAVFASCCIPLAFTPVSCPLDAHTMSLVDGTLTCRLPSQFPLAQTLLIYLAHPSAEGAVVPPRSWPNFLAGLVRCAEHGQKVAEDEALEQAAAVLTIDGLDHMPAFDFSLQLTPLFRHGYGTALDFLHEGAISRALGGTVVAVVAVIATMRAAELDAARPPDDEFEREAVPFGADTEGPPR